MARKPGGGEAQEGNGFNHWLTPGEGIANSVTEQSPEGQSRSSGASGKLLAAKSGQGREGKDRSKGRLAVGEVQTPEERTLDVAAG